jgi:glucose/mannose transport system substrate-binding protein
VCCGGPVPQKIQLVADSWWKHPSERRAFENVLQQYNGAHPDSIAVNDASESTADAVRKTLTARLLAGAGPSTFQANIGADVLHWTVVDTTDDRLPSSSRLVSLRDFFRKNQLDRVLPDALYQALIAGPTREPYTIPIDIHRLNVVYYNVKGLTDFGVRNGGASFLDPAVLCPADVAERLDNPDAKLDAKIAVGMKDTFPLTLLAFESLLPAVGGPALYDDLFHGRANGDWENEVRGALLCLQYLSRSFVGDQNVDWADALGQVVNDNADLSVMGDWANGELKDQLDSGIVQGVPFPTSVPEWRDTFVFTSDTFPLPNGAPYPVQTEELLETIASGEAQSRFSSEKGSIPARTDVDVTKLGPRAVSTKSAFDASQHKLLATSGLFPPYFPGDDLSTALSTMTRPMATKQDIEQVLLVLREMQPLLAYWQDRIAPPAAP